MSKARVRQAFSQAALTYGDAATVQRQVVAALVGFLGESWGSLGVPSSRERILDVGSGTGFARSALTQRFPHADYVALDFSEAMLRQSTAPLRLCADAEALPLCDASLDLVWSSLTWQWCALPEVLDESRRVLRDDGVLAFTTLTEPTFHELRSAFAGLDEHPHTQPMLPADVVLAAVEKAGFGAVQTHRECIVAHYPTLKSLLTGIRATGANEVAGQRRRGLLSRQAWARIEAAYAKHATPDGLPLTYDVLYVVARKKSPRPGYL
jgi:malonyl-CoA O-methyltransferase